MTQPVHKQETSATVGAGARKPPPAAPPAAAPPAAAPPPATTPPAAAPAPASGPAPAMPGWALGLATAVAEEVVQLVPQLTNAAKVGDVWAVNSATAALNLTIRAGDWDGVAKSLGLLITAHGHEMTPDTHAELLTALGENLPAPKPSAVLPVIPAAPPGK